MRSINGRASWSAMAVALVLFGSAMVVGTALAQARTAPRATTFDPFNPTLTPQRLSVPLVDRPLDGGASQPGGNELARVPIRDPLRPPVRSPFRP